MKKRLLSLLTLLTLLIFSSSIFLLVGCDDGGSDNTHVHTFNPNWTMSETEHWHDATCGCDIRSAFAGMINLESIVLPFVGTRRMNNYYATHNQGSKVTLGENVTYIGDYAFAYCLYMKDEHMGIDGRN